MMDLYRRIGLSSTTSDPTAIRDAIERCTDANVATRARAVLLDPSRKAHYDALLLRVRQVAAIRSALNLDQTVAWSSSVHAPDFASQSRPEQSRADPLRTKIGQSSSASPSARGMRYSRRAWIWCTVAAIAAALALRSGCEETSQTNTRTSNAQPIAAPQPAFELPPVQFPPTGVIRNDNAAPAPLEIKTRDARHAYYLKLVNPGSKSPVAEYFIRPGEQLNVTAPLGTYELRYATGTTWYGYDHLFGPTTAYSKADSLMVFSYGHDGYSGYSVELYLQVDGNLRTSRMDASGF
jgi:hypothetical protein